MNFHVYVETSDRIHVENEESGKPTKENSLAFKENLCNRKSSAQREERKQKGKLIGGVRQSITTKYAFTWREMEKKIITFNETYFTMTHSKREREKNKYL